MINFTTFEKKLGIDFADKNLLKQAFTHRSYLNENKGAGLEHNERLEFLGDAVLEMVVTDFLFHTFPHTTEGELTAYRAALVNTTTISEVAGELDLNEHLLLSRGESKDMGRARSIILADAFEALIGAIYLDQGYETAKQFIRTNLLEYVDLELMIKDKLWLDAKSRFQEKAQEQTGITPSYKTLKEEGPDHNKHFTLGVFLGSTQIAKGEGMSKQEAEQKAAENALKAKGW
jgi:ribonuclease III